MLLRREINKKKKFAEKDAYLFYFISFTRKIGSSAALAKTFVLGMSLWISLKEKKKKKLK